MERQGRFARLMHIDDVAHPPLVIDLRPEIATDAAALHTHQVQWSLDQARDFQDWLRTKPGKENEVIDGRWPIRR